MNRCPLCNSAEIENIEIIRKKDLLRLYIKMVKKDFSHLVKTEIEYCKCLKCDLLFFNPLISGDEYFYNALQEFPWYYVDDKYEYTMAKEFISVNDKVLEIGSGKGTFSKYINSELYTGLDFSENAKKLAAKNGINIENATIEEHAEMYPNHYDVVLSFQVMEHVSNIREFIQSQIKALKENGKLIVAVPSEDSFLKYVTNGILNMPPHHVSRWSDKTLRYLAEEFNLELICLSHEKLQKIHIDYFLNTLIANIFKTRKLIDLSIYNTIISKLAKILTRIIRKKIFEEMYPVGHTVIAVYNKR